MKKTLSLILISLLYPFYLAAQGQAPKRYLEIGDKVPDFIFPIHNYKSPKAKMSDFKGKLVILDLWATYCSSCIEAMPHMEGLQSMFDGKLQIIMVTTDNDDKISKLALHSDNVRNNKLPSVTNAGKLAKLFNYTFLPTHIWIDQNGIVKYITSGLGANEKNISSFLEGKDVKMREKKDIVVNNEEPMLVNWYPYHKEMLLYSYLAPSQKEFSASNMGTGLLRNDDGTIYKIHSGKCSLIDLYKIAFGLGTRGHYFAENRMLLSFRDSSKYKFNKQLDYREAGLTYMYEVINKNKIPDSSLYKFVQNQFDMVFNLKSNREKRIVTCNVLKRLPNDNRADSKGGPFKNDRSGNFYTVQNINWESFFDSQNFETPIQLIDETGIDPLQRVDITIDNRWKDLTLINESLKPFGLYVKKEERLLDCIILKDL